METVVDYFWTHARQQPHVRAFAEVRDDEVQWLTWSELGRVVSSWITELQRLQLPPGGHIASCLPNGLEWICIDLAAHTLGLVHVALDVREPAAQREALQKFSGACHLLDSEWLASHHPTPSDLDLSIADCRHLAAAVNRAAAAQMLFTSGSDGAPKGVLLSHHNLVVNAHAKLAAAPQLTSDLRLNVLPFAHAYARTCELSSWIVSRSQLAIADSWTSFVALGRRLSPTLINLVPYWAERAADLLESDSNALGGRVRLLQVGGAALGDELWRRLSQLGLPPLQGYGLTEASPVVCSNRAGAQRPGSVGPAVAGVEVRVDDNGILWCSGPNVMLGYWQDADSSRACMVDGWLCTGDLAEIHPDGHVTIFGRASQQIALSTGYKVSPEVIERELCSLPGVQRAVVFGNGRPHVVALLWGVSADTHGLRTANDAQQPDWAELIAQQLSRFPRHAIPTRFAWISEPLSADNGLLTLKGSLRRRQIEDRFKRVIDGL